MNEVVLIIVFALGYFLFILINKKMQNKKVRQQLESWDYWVQVVNDDSAPYFSGKIIKKSKDYQFFAVGCLHKNELGDDFIKYLTEKVDFLPDLIPCQCILTPVKLTMGELDVDKVSLIYNHIPTDKNKCLKIELDGEDIVHCDTDENIVLFNKVWDTEGMEEIDGINEDTVYKVYL